MRIFFTVAAMVILVLGSTCGTLIDGIVCVCVCVCVCSAPVGWSPLAVKFLSERFQNITLARLLLQINVCRYIVPGYCAEL